ncbi:histone deacetylase complex subunit SAP18-like isoform X2 [Hyalella azteca]|uniref:18 kDa Sin3-associated polypeptide n=1 Tax=Hyalella azteca TaxID=294128 RepID=A0A8B7N3T2_HYAAZ|nr:histone deacetylase complex subunit SAP18-like isoform X1 [Hyalella azteca]XP_047736036.1 histone deacetylase complex subunit SAP18-like isoform X2 [Hyalella azteca]
MMMSMVESKVEEKKDRAGTVVDREKTCPLLLRVFVCMGRHHHMAEYRRGATPPNGLQVYTWMDATLRELAGLVQEINPDTKRRGTQFEFALVFPDLNKMQARLREIGTIVVGHQGFEDNKTLAQSQFCIGDHLDVAITFPVRGPPGPSMRRPMRPFPMNPDYDTWNN